MLDVHSENLISIMINLSMGKNLETSFDTIIKSEDNDLFMDVALGHIYLLNKKFLEDVLLFDNINMYAGMSAHELVNVFKELNLELEIDEKAIAICTELMDKYKIYHNALIKMYIKYFEYCSRHDYKPFKMCVQYRPRLFLK